MTSPSWLSRFPSPEVAALDPSRHALIEASAGTGKTFAIEHLVLRLLMENPDWKPEEILVLSFTDKTVVELRSRIRSLMRRQVRGAGPGEGPARQPVPGWSSGDLERLHMLWLHADDLAVHTLHSFCQASLQRDPLASRALLRAEVDANEWALADAALENLLRGAWARDPDRLHRLRAALRIDAGESWRSKAIGLMLAWHPWRGDRIEPESDPGTAEALEREAAEAAGALLRAVEDVNRGAFSAASFRGSFKATRTAQEELRKHAFQKVLGKAEELLADPQDEQARAEILLDFFARAFTLASPAVKRGWDSCIPAAASSLPEWRRLAAACARLRDLGPELERARRLRSLGIRAEVTRELRAELAREKLRRGLMTYDDMLRGLVEALRAQPDLAARLRGRYKACIVDEFQDTDPVQWEILRRLCLEETLPSPAPHPQSPDSRLPLFLVGDPKQAIYGFRGGDLRTYLAARGAFRALAETGRAQGFGLIRNFRSRKPLIDGLNAVFSHPAWFGAPPEDSPDPAWHLPAGSEEVAFTSAVAGREDGGTGPCIRLREFPTIDAKGKDLSKEEVGRGMRRWIASRIAGRVAPGGGWRPDQIAVLVRRNAEGEAIGRLLRRFGVPCSVQKRGGVFRGPAADALRLLLEWIEEAASPDVQARILLLPFARRGEEDTPRGRPARCPPLIARWASLARAGRWPEFFESVRRDGGYRDRLAAESPADAVRFDRLTRLLGEAGSAPGTPARALRDRFDALRRGENSSGEDAPGAGEGQRGTEGSVTVMTLHMSKGLEFPVVFLADCGTSVQPAYYVLREKGSAGFRIVLDKEDERARTAHERQDLGEEKRLLYVAFTRAMEELHVPLLREPPGKHRFGPLGGFAAEALRAAASAEETSGLFTLDEDPLAGEFAPAVGAAAESVHPADTREDRESLLAATRDAFSRRRRLTSYSRLALRAAPHTDPAAALPSEPLLEEDGSRAQRQEPALEETPAAPETAETAGSDGTASPASAQAAPAQGITAADLPPGAAAGTALHALLEQTPFATALEADSPEAWLELPGHRARVEEALRREGLDVACAPAAARAVWNALRAPIPAPDDPAAAPFRLADLPPGDVRHEVEFLLPFGDEGGNDGAPVAEDVLPGARRRGDFLWGFIDLVFRRGGRYYLLDWKSNLLPAYDAASIARSMERHRYHLQWKLYAVALDRWLAARLPEYDADRHFGGVCYLYLRGASPDRFSGYVARPRGTDLRAAYPLELAALLAGSAGREAA